MSGLYTELEKLTNSFQIDKSITGYQPHGREITHLVVFICPPTCMCVCLWSLGRTVGSITLVLDSNWFRFLAGSGRVSEKAAMFRRFHMSTKTDHPRPQLIPQIRWKRLSVDAPSRDALLTSQYSRPIDLLTKTFHTLQQLIMTDRQRPFNYPNENGDLKVFTI